MIGVIAHHLGRDAKDNLEHIAAGETGVDESVDVRIRDPTAIADHERRKMVEGFQSRVRHRLARPQRLDHGRFHLLHLGEGGVASHAVMAFILEVRGEIDNLLFVGAQRRLGKELPKCRVT
jgi:hypothetical protein